MSDTAETAAVTDHRTLPPLTGVAEGEELEDEGQADLVETAADLEQLDEGSEE